MKRGLPILLFITIVFFSSCQKKPEGDITVKTNSITEITTNSAKGGGSVSFTGNYTISECGICYAETSQPTIRDFYTEDGFGSGSYSSMLNNLTPQTKYYVRAYAKTSSGVKYGNQVSFTTLSGGVGLPMVATNSVTNISANEATCGGNVTDDGGAIVTERGVCWDTINNPIINDMHVAASSGGTGNFTVKITDLDPGTTYHVRSYAKNSNGISYGSDVDFTTDFSTPMVNTSPPIMITYSSVEVGGEVVYDGGAPVTERGIYWGIRHNPSVYGSRAIADSDGTGNYTVSIMDLGPGTTYYYCAYAKNRKGTVYGDEEYFTTESSASTTGEIKALYSVSPTLKVYFSKGNLQYFAYSKKWRFAEHQYDYLRYSNEHISNDYDGWIDLFGWGTSGNNHGAVCYQPWKTSLTNSNYYAYGQYTYNLYDQTGQADWGSNQICNGGNLSWRTLTKDEWDYLFHGRHTTSNILFVNAKVNNVCGMLLLPDNWNAGTYPLENVNNDDASFSSNEITSSEWIELENAGVVFLPAAGYRYETSYVNILIDGNYWTASSYNSDDAHHVSFGSFGLQIFPSDRYLGRSVRLVHDVH